MTFMKQKHQTLYFEWSNFSYRPWFFFKSLIFFYPNIRNLRWAFLTNFFYAPVFLCLYWHKKTEFWMVEFVPIMICLLIIKTLAEHNSFNFCMRLICLFETKTINTLCWRVKSLWMTLILNEKIYCNYILLYTYEYVNSLRWAQFSNFFMGL